jgi:hypothetical protein
MEEIMTLKKTAAVGLFAATLAFVNVAAAAPTPMTDEDMDLVVAGTANCPTTKGNNGWGNGADPSNPGSTHGGTAASKIANASVPGAGKINTNPTKSSGR